MKEFECNVSRRMPGWINKSKKADWEAATDRIYARFDKMNEALVLSGVEIEQFLKTIVPLFQMEDAAGNSVMDAMTAKQVAEIAKTGAFLDFVPREEFPNAGVMIETAFLMRKEWETVARGMGTGGSEAAAIIGAAGSYQTKRDVHYRKVGIDPVNPKPDPGKNFIFAYGHAVEPLVIETFCKMSGAKVIPETRMFYKKDYPYITANIDGIVRMPNGDLKIFEAKTTTNFNKGAWDGDLIPPQYIPQLNQYMSVLDDPRITSAYIGCIYGNTVNEFKCKEYMRDIAEENRQNELIKDFWENHVLTGEVPPLSGNGEKDLADLREYVAPRPKTYAEDIGALRDDVEAFMRADSERAALEAQAKSKKELCDALKAKIIDGMGDNDTGYVDLDGTTGLVVSWKSRSKDEFDKKKFKKDHPDLYDQYNTHTEDASRTFSVKEKLMTSIATK